MNKKLVTIFGLGVILTLISAPVVLLAFVLSLCWLFITGSIVGAVGVFLMAFSVFIKLASLLFRA